MLGKHSLRKQPVFMGWLPLKFAFYVRGGHEEMMLVGGGQCAILGFCIYSKLSCSRFGVKVCFSDFLLSPASSNFAKRFSMNWWRGDSCDPTATPGPKGNLTCRKKQTRFEGRLKNDSFFALPCFYPELRGPCPSSR